VLSKWSLPSFSFASNFTKTSPIHADMIAIVHRSVLLLILCVTASFAAAQQIPDLEKFNDPSVWRIHNRAATTVPDRDKALRLDARQDDGMVWLVGSKFSEGTINLDLRGANKPGQSFVGVAFRGIDDTTFDAIYFRPFNFKNPDIARRSRAVQYVSQPKYTWEKLRKDSPGKYENAVSPVPDPDGWFHARIEIEGQTIRVFVNDATSPCLEVTALSEPRAGMIGLWVGNGSSGDFANLEITSKP
jgi:hypothetical protein